MNEDVITDLKQFIAATIRQKLSGFATKDDLKSLATKSDLDTQIKGLRSEMNTRFDDMDAKLDAIADAYAGNPGRPRAASFPP